MTRERLDYLDIAKALCIVLVVVGHYNPSVCPDWWLAVRAVIYSFHMPLFMFISGLLFAYTWKKTSYPEFIKKKFFRLMVPYLCTSVLIIGIKLLMQNVLHVTNEAAPADLLRMFWQPSAAVHLWFIWALMIIFLVVPIFDSKIYRLILAAAALLLWLLPLNPPAIFSLDRVCGMAVFFMAGVLFCDYGGLKKWPLWLEILIIALFVFLETRLAIGRAVAGRLLPFFGIGAVLVVSKWISRIIAKDKPSILMTLGKYSFIIFLFHTIFTEFAKSMLALCGITPANHFVLCLAVVIVVGLSIPILVKKYIIDRIPILSKCFPL